MSKRTFKKQNSGDSESFKELQKELLNDEEDLSVNTKLLPDEEIEDNLAVIKEQKKNVYERRNTEDIAIKIQPKQKTSQQAQNDRIASDTSEIKDYVDGIFNKGVEGNSFI